MDTKDKAQCAELLLIMDDARRRQIHAHADAMKYRPDTITGSRRYATYERQYERYQDAAAKLAALIAAA